MDSLIEIICDYPKETFLKEAVGNLFVTCFYGEPDIIDYENSCPDFYLEDNVPFLALEIIEINDSDCFLVKIVQENRIGTIILRDMDFIFQKIKPWKL